MPMNVWITGSHGLIGTALSQALVSRGDTVTAVARDGAQLRLDGLGQADAIVHLAGAGIGDKKWTEERKRELLDSRIKPTSQLAAALAALPSEQRPAVWVSGSAIGYYGDRGDEVLTEDSSNGDGFLADLVRQWEAATKPAEDAGVRVVHIRTGLVMGPGGLLEPLLLPFKLGLGGPIGGGKQWFSWVALEDEVGAILHAVDNDQVRGPLNATAPNPVTYGQFAHTLGSVLHRPAFIPTPKFAVAAKLGKEGAREMTLAGQRVQPAKLQATGYSFAFTELRPAIEAALANR
jgi:uncharacterized protein (TIGR01777 family)